jgi:predicted flap endonuclease-1-like 5' DNA nuclease
MLMLTVLFATSTFTFAEEKKEKPAAKQEETKKSTKKDESVEKILKYLNSATQEELEAISGIGPKLAQLIMEGRPYESLDDVLAIKGIGEKKLAKITEFIENPPTETAEDKKAKDSKKDTKDDTKKESKEDTKEESKKEEKSKK